MTQQPTVVPQPVAAAMTPADILRIVRKRLWLIVACFVVFGLGGTAGLVAWYVTAPRFTAEGILSVEPAQGGNPITGGFDPAIPIPLLEGWIQGQVQAIRSDRVLRAAIQAADADLQKEGASLVMYTGPNPGGDLKRDLDIVHPRDSLYIAVSLRGTRKEQIRAIVKAVLDQFIKQHKDDRTASEADRRRELTSERDDLQRQLNDLSRRLSSMRDERGLIVADERNSEQLARLNTLTRQEAEVRTILAETKAAWDDFTALKKQSDEQKDASILVMAFPEIMETMRNDRTIADQSDRFARAQQDLQLLKQKFGPANETVKRTETQVTAMANELARKQSEVLGQLIQWVAATLKSKYDRAQAAAVDLQARVAEARAAAVDASKVVTEYSARADEFRRVQTLLGTVMDGLERMRIAAAIALPTINIAQPPTLPDEPSEPRLAIYIPSAIIFSVLLGFGLSLLLELMDTRLRTPSQVVRQVGLPLLASVPDLTEDERLAMDTNVALVSQKAPQSLLAESFRQLRTSLLFSSDTSVKSILVTSPNPGDGKSTVAANLAATMARSGARVLLIEANFRRPSLARTFDCPATVGLSNVLVGLSSAAEAIQATAIENLDVLTCGALPPSPAELLGSHSMRQLMTEQARAYDHVIVDGAPILVVADNHLLAEVVDGIILVFRAGENTRGIALRAAAQMRALRGRLLGAVLNRVRATKGGYFRESFQAYYDYAGTACPVDVATGVPPTAMARPRLLNGKNGAGGKSTGTSTSRPGSDRTGDT